MFHAPSLPASPQRATRAVAGLLAFPEMRRLGSSRLAGVPASRAASAVAQLAELAGLLASWRGAKRLVCATDRLGSLGARQQGGKARPDRSPARRHARRGRLGASPAVFRAAGGTFVAWFVSSCNHPPRDKYQIYHEPRYQISTKARSLRARGIDKQRPCTLHSYHVRHESPPAFAADPRQAHGSLRGCRWSRNRPCWTLRA